MATSVKRGEAGNVVTGTFNANGSSQSVQLAGVANFVLSGSFSATLRLSVSFDAGTTWIAVTTGDGVVRTFTGPERVVLDEPEDGVLYRVECSGFVSGPVNWRFSK